MLKTVVECLDVGQDSNGLEIEAGHVKECKSRPMSKGALLQALMWCLGAKPFLVKVLLF
jgi:hypothetical protein